MSRTSDVRPLSRFEMLEIRRSFQACGYSVRPLDGESFEFTAEEFRVPTHVFATPYFLQFTAFAFAVPRLAKGRKVATRDHLLNELNCGTNLVKVTCDDAEISPAYPGWRFQVQAKLTPGIVRSRYSEEVIRGFVGLWIAEFVQIIVAKEEHCGGVYRTSKEAQPGATDNPDDAQRN